MWDSIFTPSVLYFYKANGKLLIEFSIFEDCHSERSGGAVYASGIYECVINNVCSYKCYAPNSGGQFIYAWLENGKPSVLSSSICSTYDVSGNEAPIHFLYGSQLCHSVNISNYKVSFYSAIYYYEANEQSNITYCSFVSTHAVKFNCVYLYFSSSTYTIASCNIVNNTQESNSLSTISCYKATDVKHSNFIDNNAAYLFYLDFSNPTVTLENTYIKHKTSIGLSNTAGRTSETVKIELEFIDCTRLSNIFRNTSYIYYYIFFVNFLRASLFPSTYI